MKLAVLTTLFATVWIANSQIDNRKLKCAICRNTLDELGRELSKVDPHKDIEVGNYRLDAKGNSIQKKVPLAQSEVHISEMLDEICDKMDDYVRGTMKTTGELVVMKLMDEKNGMNPLISEIDIIQDGDLNKSLKYYCEAVVDEFEDDIIHVYQNKIKYPKTKVCTAIADFCDDTPDDEENEASNAAKEEL